MKLHKLIFQASYGRREIEIAEQEMPGIMALRKKASVCRYLTFNCYYITQSLYAEDQFLKESRM